MATKFHVRGRPTYIIGRIVDNSTIDSFERNEIRAIVWCIGPETAYLQWKDQYAGEFGLYSIWQVDQDGHAVNTLQIRDFR